MTSTTCLWHRKAFFDMSMCYDIIKVCYRIERNDMSRKDRQHLHDMKISTMSRRISAVCLQGSLTTTYILPCQHWKKVQGTVQNKVQYKRWHFALSSLLTQNSNSLTCCSVMFLRVHNSNSVIQLIHKLHLSTLENICFFITTC